MIITSTIKNNLELALKLARKYPHKQQNHHAAILTKRRKVISIGVNKKKTHTKSNTKYGYIHAELDAVLGVDKEILRGATLFVVRAGFNFRRIVMNSKPCKYCQAMIIETGIRKVIYTLGNDRIGIWFPKSNREEIVSLQGWLR